MSQGGGHGGTVPAATSRIGETREGREDSQGVCCICCMSLTAGRNLQSNVRAGNKRSGPVEELQGPATLMAFTMHFSTQFLVWMAGNSPGSEMPEVQVAVLHFLAAASLGY